MVHIGRFNGSNLKVLATSSKFGSHISSHDMCHQQTKVGSCGGIIN